MTTFRTPSILAGLCVALFGCGESPACSQVPCGTVVVVSPTDGSTLFPPHVDSEIDRAIGDLVFLKLADIGNALNTYRDSGFTPRLASSWRFVDSLNIEFQLDPRARWQDGVPVTAQDVAFTFDVYRDPLVASPARPLLDRIASVTASGDRTVVFRFRQPYVEQFYDATFHMRIVPRHLLDSIPRNRLGSHPLARAPIGDGPFRFVEWKANASIEFVADTTFFLGKPGLARVIFKATPDPGTAFTQLMADEADVMSYLGAPENAERAQAAPQVRVVKYPSMAYTYLGLNNRDPLLQDRDLRRAIAQAVDRQTVMQAAYVGTAIVPPGPMSQIAALVRDTGITQIAFDTVAARNTLTRLGWRDTNGDGVLDRGAQRLQFGLLIPGSSGVRNRAAVVIQEQLKRMGISVQIQPVDFNTFLDRTGKHRFAAAIIGWNEDPTPAGIQQSWVTSAIDIGTNYTAYSNPEVDRLVALAIATSDAAAGRRLWRQVYSTINQDAPGIWLAAPLQVAGVHKRLENVSFRSEQWAGNLWQWRVTPGQAIHRDQAGPGVDSR